MSFCVWVWLCRVSVSRAIKPLLEAESGSADYFSHKNCAQQYSSMLDKAGTHKRRRSVEGTNEVGKGKGKGKERIVFQ